METREADLVKRENMKKAQLRKARKIQVHINTHNIVVVIIEKKLERKCKSVHVIKHHNDIMHDVMYMYQ